MTYRSFADANKIGATGLRGRSWPDLDMLPFGRLTDAGAHLSITLCNFCCRNAWLSSTSCALVANHWKTLNLSLIQVLTRALTEAPTLHLTNN